MTDNRYVFSTVEFGSWAYRSRLIKAERFLIERYLEKNSKTLEAGTGGGRVLFEMKALGFEHLFGFDFVPQFIKLAKKRDTTGTSFEVGDAVRLGYLNSSFDQIIYLQQIICCIDEGASRGRALIESAKARGTASSNRARSSTGRHMYWYKAREICDLLCGAGFRITAVGSSHQIERGEMCETVGVLGKEPITGMLYVV